MYEYLPSFLGEDVSPYPGYKPDTHPGISHVFQSAAFRYQLFSINDFYDLKMHENTTYFWTSPTKKNIKGVDGWWNLLKMSSDRIRNSCSTNQSQSCYFTFSFQENCTKISFAVVSCKALKTSQNRISLIDLLGNFLPQQRFLKPFYNSHMTWNVKMRRIMKLNIQTMTIVTFLIDRLWRTWTLKQWKLTLTQKITLNILNHKQINYAEVWIQRF